MTAEGRFIPLRRVVHRLRGYRKAEGARIWRPGAMRMTFALLLLLSASAFAADLEVGGYFEPQFSGVALDSEFQQLNTSKLRVDLADDIADNIAFTGNFNFLNYQGQTEWCLVDYLPQALAVAIPDSLRPEYQLEYEDDVKLDNAYLRMYAGSATITVGRQQISFGSGYAWNPTDHFNTKSILDPTYEQPGVDGLRLDLTPASGLDLTMLYSPESDWKKSGKLVRVTARLGRFDLAASLGQVTETGAACRRDMLGVDVVGQALGLGCWSENALTELDGDQYWANIVGVDYTFESGWYVMTEYYRNEEGATGSYSLGDWIGYLTGEAKTLSRDQVYAYTLYPLTDLVNIGGSVIVSANDGGALIVPTWDYSISDETTLSFFGSIYTGDAGDMYSRDLGSGGMIRLRAYF